MKIKTTWFLASVLAALAAGAAPAADPAPVAGAGLRIAIVGDSTVCDYPAASPCRGWGQFVQERFQSSVAVTNLACSGRSTKTFRKEGRWRNTLAAKPDFVLIQFGHNDSHGAGRPEATDAAGDFREYLRQYVDEARAAGATPILVTPMCRRNFGADGKLQDILAPYAEAMKAVAAEKKAPVIDLYAASVRLTESMGPARAPEFASTDKDRTHFNEKGARAMAEIVLKELPRAEPRLGARMRP